MEECIVCKDSTTNQILVNRTEKIRIPICRDCLVVDVSIGGINAS